MRERKRERERGRERERQGGGGVVGRRLSIPVVQCPPYAK